MWHLDKLKRENTLTLEEYECLSSVKALELIYYAAEHAGEVRKEVYGNEVYIRGLIKISNQCGNDCFYCGIRRSNKNCERYFLPREQILACCAKGYVLGLRTFVLQGGVGTITEDTICDINIISASRSVNAHRLHIVLFRRTVTSKHEEKDACRETPMNSGFFAFFGKIF